MAIKKLVFPAAIVILVFLFVLTFNKVELLKTDSKDAGRRIFVPSSKFLKPAVLGYDSMAAAFYWLKTIQYIGDSTQSKRKYPQIYPLLNLVTDLDPKFEYAYEVGGVILSVYAKRIEESIALLKKGDKEGLGYWEIPFFIGFNYFYYLGDYDSAARYISKAAQMPRHPAYLPKLAARLYAQAGSPELALDFLQRVYENTQDENVKRALEERMKDVLVERDVTFLNKALKIYRERYGKYPVDINLLVSKGIIKELPKEPFGGHYYIDSRTHEVKSSVKKERLKVHKQKLIK